MVFSYSISHDWPDTSRIIGAYIVIYKGGKIDHCTHVTGPVAQYSADNEYNSAFTAGIYIAYFRGINN